MLMRRPLATTLLTLLLMSSPALGEEILADFETADHGAWRVEGDAFGSAPAAGTLADQQQVAGYRGERLINSFHGGDGSTGVLTSPDFVISHDYLVFLVGGGSDVEQTGVELLVEDRPVRRAAGDDSESLRWHAWDVRPFAGKQARLRIFDRARGGWGHILADQITLAAAPRTGFDSSRIEAYRASPGYYRERYRPRFHFTPELNWMNDPNGLVYHQGEYHLFYQFNPLGNAWGHMSWGHAVSQDLVQWKHLPVALTEEDGVMIFSGSAVVDWRNTSGFGVDDDPSLVAIYTGHGPDEQTQCLAYSNDRGRTWTKYAGNPVLDEDMRDFRDPKVFWHEPTRKWIMIVALAADKRVRLYGSQDLKQWTRLSDFGPAGAVDKPNWECPDLFLLPIDGEPGNHKWVLEVDMGGGSIAGGSGGEYFIGEFDGTTFRSDHPLEEVRWVDYGRDFYAPVSWSDVPETDGRRIWIGWMNNWQTSQLPTSPWRGAMSLPRILSLRRVGDELKLAQTPIEELRRLRGEQTQVENISIEGRAPQPGGKTIAGDCLEIIAEFELGSAREFGLHVRQGEGEQTTIGYDVAKENLFVDRRRSGEVDFHEAFPGRHAGPLKPEDGRIRLHIFVDASSVEVFGGGGETVITDRIFPRPESQGMEIYAEGGAVRLVRLDAWKLPSTWHGADR